MNTGSKICAILKILESALLVIFISFLFLGRTVPHLIFMPVIAEIILLEQIAWILYGDVLIL